MESFGNLNGLQGHPPWQERAPLEVSRVPCRPVLGPGMYGGYEGHRIQIDLGSHLVVMATQHLTGT